MSTTQRYSLPLLVATTLCLHACNNNGGSTTVDVPNIKPSYLSGSIKQTYYDGVSDDLLTGGLGLTGLKGTTPVFANPLAPTVAELRRNAIYTNYRAIVDYTDLGGFGRLYGPNIDKSGQATLGEGKVAGYEYLAVVDDGTGQQNVTLMVQVPTSFNPHNACIVTGTSSGSRGIYGAIGTAGEWGLKHGCAVAYTDKGTGNGYYDITSNKILNLSGQLVDQAMAGTQASFQPNLTDNERAALPNRVAYKHAHSQQNPEQNWGKNTLQAVELAFYVLNERYGALNSNQQRLQTITPDNTLVIASSVSNGGGAALAAAEQDTQNLIDGVAVSEPNAQPGSNTSLTIKQGSQTISTHSKPLADYFSYANLYQPCAVLSPQAGLSLAPNFWPVAFTQIAQNRCAALATKGLLSSTTLSTQADEALAKLHAYGWQAEQNFLQQSHFRLATNSIVMTYVNSYGRFKASDNVCGYSFANTDATGNVITQNPALQAALFATGNGVPPTGGVNIVYNNSVGGAKLDFIGVSSSTQLADFALDGALCMRSLVTGKDAVTGAALTGNLKAQSDRVMAGMQAVQLTANLQSKPTIIVTGRSDTLIPPNHAARAYVGKAFINGATTSNLSYIEVTNAQHFDAFIALGSLLQYDTHFIPLHVYFSRAMDAMWAHLKSKQALPASQVVYTTPRTSSTQALETTHVPQWVTAPTTQAISLSNNTLAIPD